MPTGSVGADLGTKIRLTLKGTVEKPTKAAVLRLPMLRSTYVNQSHWHSEDTTSEDCSQRMV